MRVWLDADVLIWHLRGEPQARGFLAGLRATPAHELWVSAWQRAEILFFMRPEEKEATFGLLAQCKTQPVNQEIVDLAAEFYRLWNPSHGMDVGDAILAASVRLAGGTLFSLNVRHYPLDEIVVKRPWEPLSGGASQP